MAPGAAESGRRRADQAWENVDLRFWEGGRGRQTPIALLWRGDWRPVLLISEELHRPPQPGGNDQRRYRLADQEGRRWEVRGQDKAWQGRPLAGAPAGAGERIV